MSGAVPELLESAGLDPTLPPLLAAALAAHERSRWPGVAFRYSRLTSSGYPVELAATSGGELRFTVEPAAPEHPPADRLSHALALLSSLSPYHRTILRSCQSVGDLRWGGWISGSWHDAGRGKLYLELPTEATIPDPLIGNLPAMPPGAQPRMVGLDPATGRWELYLRTSGLELWQLKATLSALGLESAELLEAIANLRRHPGAELPTRQVGLSFTVDATGGVVAFSLSFVGRALGGSDSRLRERLLREADRQGWNLAGYAALSAVLAHRWPTAGHHGMVSLSVGHDAGTAVQIGLCPRPRGN